MRIAILSVIISALSALVTACEGECIVGITNAFISNYTVPVINVFEILVDQVVAKLLPDRRYASPPVSLMSPILSAYRRNAHSGLETAIFPSYFHGKCQRPDPNNPDGPPVNPIGCPNPDCPVVCGTPGSMVHFYPKLRYIAFEETRRELQAIASPGTEAYHAVEKNILSEADAGRDSRRNVASRLGGTRMPQQRRHEEHRKRELQKIMSELPSELEKRCGGTAAGVTNGLPKCSWEKEMKSYILSFP